jgi:hypothetical protein
MELDEQEDDDQAPPPSSGEGGAPSQRRAKYFKTNRQFGSKTDPDANLVRQGGLKSRLRYKSHRVVDDAHEIITALETTNPVLRRKA